MLEKTHFVKIVSGRSLPLKLLRPAFPLEFPLCQLIPFLTLCSDFAAPPQTVSSLHLGAGVPFSLTLGVEACCLPSWPICGKPGHSAGSLSPEWF